MVRHSHHQERALLQHQVLLHAQAPPRIVWHVIGVVPEHRRVPGLVDVDISKTVPYKKFEDKQTKKCAKACDDNPSFIDYIVLCGMDNYLKVFLMQAQATQVTQQAGAWHKDKANTAVGCATDNIEFEQTQEQEGGVNEK